MARLPLVFLAALPLMAQDVTRLTARLAEEASAFERVAPQVLGRETLEQRGSSRSSD